ncbi:hypothetical protein AB835_14250 [Candidatus Endobugula sertula]|uniref:Uncharacterized protein n=1 Tax=Candidatus Endobugula sertula TaxID=62101 RepID=A0A1D2QLI1_9GAMM|nr:hypothetical protein AB835_14250 [Candidatus Endobugula sertula]
MKVIAKHKNEEQGYIEYHLVQVGSWDLFGDLVSFFEQYYDALVHVKTDGIHTRKWQIRCRDEYFMFEHNEDVGNWFYSCSDEGDSPLMHEISEELERRLSEPTESE